MAYTEEQIEIFNRMFYISAEHTCYTSQKLTPGGLEEGEIDDMSYNTGRAYIVLSNLHEYSIDYGESNDAEGYGMDAFNKLIELDYDESAFEAYLLNESSFKPV